MLFFWQIIMDSLLTYLSFISVLKMTVSETNFGMTKTCFFIAFRVWFGTLNFDIGRGNFMYCMQVCMMSSIFHWLGHESQVFGMWTFWTSIRELQDQSGKGRSQSVAWRVFVCVQVQEKMPERSMMCVCKCKRRSQSVAWRGCSSWHERYCPTPPHPSPPYHRYA